MAENIGYDYQPETAGGIFLRLKKKGDVIKIRLASTPVHYQREYEGKQQEKFGWLVLDRNEEDPKKKVKVFSSGVSVYLIVKGLTENEDWGDPTSYDLTITRIEESTANFYRVVPSPKKSPITKEEKEAIGESKIDLIKLFQGKGTKTFGQPRTVNEEPPISEPKS